MQCLAAATEVCKGPSTATLNPHPHHAQLSDCWRYIHSHSHTYKQGAAGHTLPVVAISSCIVVPAFQCGGFSIFEVISKDGQCCCKQACILIDYGLPFLAANVVLRLLLVVAQVRHAWV